MEIRDNEKYCIFTPLSSVLNKYESLRLLSEIEKENRCIAIDLAYVGDCTIDFIEALKKISEKKEIGVFNISSDIFVLLNTMSVDKKVKLFVNEIDFFKNTRRLLNRKFALIS
jgi:hypothetical protein